jgi:hypothetical protein
MDQYQTKLLTEGTSLYDAKGEQMVNPWPSESITIVQDNDYHITQYSYYLKTTILAKLLAFQDNEWKEIPASQIPDCRQDDRLVPGYVLVFDFDDRISKIKLVFKNNLADDFEMNIVYQESDKQAFDSQCEQERIEELIKEMNIHTGTGDSLINVYFKPACPEYASAEVVLYKSLVNNGSVSLLDNMLIGKYEVKEGFFFQSITDLAYGFYCIKVIQKDKNGKEIVSSPLISVEISAPRYPTGRDFVSI